MVTPTKGWLELGQMETMMVRPTVETKGWLESGWMESTVQAMMARPTVETTELGPLMALLLPLHNHQQQEHEEQEQAQLVPLMCYNQQ